MSDASKQGMVLLGCGRMGSAMLKGWLDGGWRPEVVNVIDPNPSEWLLSSGVKINEEINGCPSVVLIAVKPQMMAEALPALQKLGNGETLFITVAAGVSIESYQKILGEQTPIIRAMPNTPAAIGKGITGMVGNAVTTELHRDMAAELLASVGQVVRLEREEDLRPLTAISGSGPAYVFHLIEAMAEAGTQAGLKPEIALQLAKATVAGAGALAEAAEDSPAQLRINVTSPGGVTAEALKVLMDEEQGFTPLMHRAVAAVIKRDEELS